MSAESDGWDEIEIIPGANVVRRTIQFIGGSLGRLSMLPAQTDPAVAHREPRGAAEVLDEALVVEPFVPEFNTSER
jgi:hypothetical protein